VTLMARGARSLARRFFAYFNDGNYLQSIMLSCWLTYVGSYQTPTCAFMDLSTAKTSNCRRVAAT
jgi:hypothetical protein